MRIFACVKSVSQPKLSPRIVLASCKQVLSISIKPSEAMLDELEPKNPYKADVLESNLYYFVDEPKVPNVS